MTCPELTPSDASGIWSLGECILRLGQRKTLPELYSAPSPPPPSYRAVCGIWSGRVVVVGFSFVGILGVPLTFAIFVSPPPAFALAAFEDLSSAKRGVTVGVFGCGGGGGYQVGQWDLFAFFAEIDD
ncbi:hypothetical protein BJ165DRAFT_1406995 [Panaeolus papilionaceus]|nr:hypothetical protein BJ165DRAFT_1406995 [Panaeolus papilionaceus]